MVKIKKPAILSLISLIFFLIIAFNLNNSFLVNLDSQTNRLMVGLENPQNILLSKYLGEIFSTSILLIVLLCIAGYHWLKKEKKDALFASLGIVLGAGLVFILKGIVHRARPLNSLITETDFGFPSGHSTISLIFFGIILYLIWKKTQSLKVKITALLISIAMILIISTSRLYLNVHYLSDIVAGLLLGTFILTLAIIFRKQIEKIESKF